MPRGSVVFSGFSKAGKLPSAICEVSGVKSGRPEDHGLVYVVPSRDAILVLERRDARAAKWWRKHTPHMLEPGRNFVFAAAVCELLPEVESP